LSASGWPTGWPGLPLYYSNVATQTLILDHAVQTHFLLFCSAAAPGHAQLVDAFYQAAQNFTEHRRRPLHVVMPLEEAATAGVVKFFKLEPADFPIAMIVEVSKGMKAYYQKVHATGDATPLATPGVLSAFEQVCRHRTARHAPVGAGGTKHSWPQRALPIMSGPASPTAVTPGAFVQAFLLGLAAPGEVVTRADGRASPRLKSMPEGAAQSSEYIYDMVGSEFGGLVLASDKDVLLFFYRRGRGGSVATGIRALQNQRAELGSRPAARLQPNVRRVHRVQGEIHGGRAAARQGAAGAPSGPDGRHSQPGRP
jgi:hypothetical protein